MYAYNPRKKSYQQLEKSLVGNDRWDVLNNILQEMALEDGEGPKQHWIIIGPRGIGKSHLMTLLYYKVKEDRELSKFWIPVLFPEDLRMAGNLPKFLERAVNEILLELEQEKKPISHDLKQKITHIIKLPLSERAESLFTIISWIHQKTGKFILLLTENLQQLLGKKINSIEQKKLRAFLQTSDAALIIGSATTIFNALHDHSHPFYHFFHIRRLEDLDFDSMKNLIVNLLSESERPELIKEIKNKNARLKTLYSFTGGNPRMAVFLTDIIKTEAPDEMLELMDSILDQLTPYFESILNDMPDYLEEIINTLAAFEPAQSPKEIAEHLEVPQATIRNYLKQLKETGYVRIAFSKGKSNYYCLNEYLYRIWYQMRDSGHREETRWLMELLLMLYSTDDILEEKNRIDPHVEMEKIVSPYKKYILQAADFIVSNPEYCKVIELSVDSMITDEEKKSVSQKEKELIKEVIKYIDENQKERAIKKCKEILNINPESEDAYGFWGDCLREQDRYDEAIEKFKKAIDINPKSEQAYWVWGACLRRMGRSDEAIEKFKKAIKINSKSFEAYGAMGDCYRELGRYDEAEKNYKKATGINEKYEDAYLAWGYSLREQKHYEEAIDKFKKAIELNPKSENIYWLLGDCLNKLARYEEAVELFKKHLSDNQDSDVIHSYGDCLMGMKRYDEALGKFERLMHDEPEYYQVYLSYGQLLKKKRKKEHAIYAYLKYINIGSGTLTRDFDFQKPYKEHMLPLIKTLTPGKYIKQFYTPEQNGKISSPQLSILLILSGKYDIVSEHIQEIVKTFLKKENEKKNDFDLFIFTIKLSIWLKLCEGNIHNATRLTDLYLEYIKSLKTTKQKEDEVSRLSLGLLRIQINFTIDANNILKILNRLDDEDGVPFNNVFLKVWTCISKPDSVDAQKYLNEKAIAEVVKELKE